MIANGSEQDWLCIAGTTLTVVLKAWVSDRTYQSTLAHASKPKFLIVRNFSLEVSTTSQGNYQERGQKDLKHINVIKPKIAKSPISRKPHFKDTSVVKTTIVPTATSTSTDGRPNAQQTIETYVKTYMASEKEPSLRDFLDTCISEAAATTDSRTDVKRVWTKRYQTVAKQLNVDNIVDKNIDWDDIKAQVESIKKEQCKSKRSRPTTSTETSKSGSWELTAEAKDRFIKDSQSMEEDKKWLLQTKEDGTKVYLEDIMFQYRMECDYEQWIQEKQKQEAAAREARHCEQEKERQSEEEQMRKEQEVRAQKRRKEEAEVLERRRKKIEEHERRERELALKREAEEKAVEKHLYKGQGRKQNVRLGKYGFVKKRSNEGFF
ncbi:hypothetical protein BDB00DRAFT_787527 [Zychaea mexicana]|uniref:uncharacterized protein n=1 Tax=Zychaea mexicana TaxID=64656 RepID=UPI0022FE8050|nr:uncharacterized protein BDB00DRAFT_787527 [Zychaea mexicana]KAI9494108.1 hypothetical protein BDB00DRAFT_787527 [Zychaea mexicana]